MKYIIYSMFSCQFVILHPFFHVVYIAPIHKTDKSIVMLRKLMVKFIHSSSIDQQWSDSLDLLCLVREIISLQRGSAHATPSLYCRSLPGAPVSSFLWWLTFVNRLQSLETSNFLPSTSSHIINGFHLINNPLSIVYTQWLSCGPSEYCNSFDCNPVVAVRLLSTPNEYPNSFVTLPLGNQTAA